MNRNDGEQFARCVGRILMTLLFLALLTTGATRASPPDPGPRGINWDAVRTKVERCDWARTAMKDMEKRVALTRSQFPDPPVGVSGWAHDYFCEKDANKLRYDPNKPNEHVCAKCGEIYSGGRHDEAWVDATYKRIHLAARESGMLYRITRDPAQASYGRHVLLWFADNIDRFQPHGKHAGKGRVMGQSLCEATSMVDLSLAYWDLFPALSPQERERIAQRLLLPSAEFIHRQTGAIHNIHSWHNAAVGLIGLACGENKWVDAALDGPFGLKAQIAKGVQDDGFWYEGSIGYHFYTLRSLQDFHLALRARGCDLSGPATTKFRLMYTAPLDYACGNFALPSINDGWAGGRLDSTAPHYEYASALWPKDEYIARTLSWFYRAKKRGSAEALLMGPETLPPAEPPPKKSALLAATGYAILRDGPTEFLVKFGPYGGGHDHLDRLNAILYRNGREIMPDTGTAGYGIKLNRWYRSPSAHNMLVVDGKPQAKCGGYLVSFATNRVEAGVKDAYAGVDIRRAVTLSGGGATDRVTAASPTNHTYELFYHVRGTLELSSVEWRPGALAGRKRDEGVASPTSKTDDGAAGVLPGSEWLKDVSAASCDGKASFTFGLSGSNEKMTMDLTSPAPFEIFTGLCPDNPADRQLTFLALRVRGKTADWTARIVFPLSSGVAQ